jgi:hypothetical protein
MKIRFPLISATLSLVLFVSPAAGAAADGLAAWWSFDQVKDRQTMDSSGKVADTIGGNFKSVPGVVGSALKLDGFTTEIVRPAATAPQPGGAFTVEAWLALGAYPWNWCPIVNQSRGQEAGYSFAVGPRGQLSLQAAAGGQWVTCTSQEFALPLRKWTHVAAVFEQGKCIRIHVNGAEAGSVPAAGELAVANDADLRIGVIPAPVKPSNIHRENGTLVGWFSLDGILDELKIHRRALSSDEVQAAFAAVVPTSAPDLPLRKMPSGPPGPGRFGAYYTQLKYYDEWDALWRVGPDPDVLVRFDESAARVVFWRGTRYSPAWVSENDLWMADQSVEAWNNEEGCFEHMQDPHCLYSHVRIIENSDARVVIHWRYAPVSAHNHLWRVDPKTGYACWVDEYYTIYPDAAGVRKVTWQAGTLGDPHQFQESLPFTQPGQHSNDVVEKDFCTVANLKGDSAKLSFVAEPAKVKDGLPPDLSMQIYNFKARNRPFIIHESGTELHNVNDRNEKDWTRPGACSHWPVGQLPCDGRTSQAPDQPTHFLGFPIAYPPVHTDGTREWWNSLYGMTDKPITELAKLARSWAQAPDLVVTGDGFRSTGFDRGERAYQLTRDAATAGKPLECQIRASEESPLVNLALVIQNWGEAAATLQIDGQTVARGKQFRLGHRYLLDGATLLVWIKLDTTKPVTRRLAAAD